MEGPFKSWHEAKDAACATWSMRPGALFDSQAWLMRQRQFRDSLGSGHPQDSLPVLARSSTLPLLLQGVNLPRIVDLGGGSGWIYALLRSSALTVTGYVVLDRPDVCAFFSMYEDASLRYVPFDDWEVSAYGANAWDIVYCNSSLQYSRSIQFLVQLVRTLKPRWVLLNDTLVTGGGADTFAVQLNSDNPEPIRCLSVGLLAGQLASLGLRLVWRVPFFAAGIQKLGRHHRRGRTSNDSRARISPFQGWIMHPSFRQCACLCAMQSVRHGAMKVLMAPED